MKRREFITLLGGAAAWPLAAPAQQPAITVVGFLSNGSLEGFSPYLATFRQGLGEAGFVEGRNVAIEYRRADNDNERLQGMAADLLRARASVIVAPTLFGPLYSTPGIHRFTRLR
jgi:putative ABC transport system substrate-binding protein